MEVFKMDKVKILELEIKEKIDFIKENLIKRLKHQDDSVTSSATEDLRNKVVKLGIENSDLRAEIENLKENHAKDIEKVEHLLKQLSELMEKNDA